MKQYTIPSLLSVDPLADFEFSFPTKNLEPWWDDYDTSTSLCATSDYGSDGEHSMDLTALLSSYKSRKGSDISVIIESPTPHQIYFHSTPKSKPTAEPEPCVSTDRFLDKIICDIAHNAPKNVYKKRKSAMRRRRKRRQRKLLSSSNVEPEFRSIWTHSNVGDLFVQTPGPNVSVPPVDNYPTVDLTEVNKMMLKRVDVQLFPIKSCSSDPSFYNGCGWTNSGLVHGGNAFGFLPGILTDLGPVALPDKPFYGHVWSDSGWVVKASPPAPVEDSGGGGPQYQGGRLPEGGRRTPRGGGRGQGERTGGGRRVALPS